jgi:hypothetical protein
MTKRRKKLRGKVEKVIRPVVCNRNHFTQPDMSAKAR